MNKITATIITYNEGLRISQCLKSLEGVADEIIVVDSFSSDNTIEICKSFGCKISQRKFNGFGAQKQYALSLASFSYVLSIDADEILSDELRHSILNLKQQGFSHRIYSMECLNFYGNRPILHSGWNHHVPTRLFDKRYASWNLRDVNEAVIFPPTLTPHLIPGKLLHYKCNSREELFHKEERDATINAQILASEGCNPSFFAPFLHSAIAFFRIYVLHLGFIDGTPGKEISLIAAQTSYITYHLARKYAKSVKH